MPLGAVSEMGRSAVWSVQVVTGASNSPGAADCFGERFGGTYVGGRPGPAGLRGEGRPFQDAPRAAGPGGAGRSWRAGPVLGEITPQGRGGLDALEQQIELDLLVRRVPAVGGDGDAEEQHGCAEDVLEVGGGAGATFAGEADRA